MLPQPVRCRAQLCRTARQRSRVTCRAAHAKEVWIQTTDKATLLAALENGVNTSVFHDAAAAAAAAHYAHFRQLVLGAPHAHELDSDCHYMPLTEATAHGKEVGRVYPVHGPQDVKRLEALAATHPTSLGSHIIMDATDWKVIPAENLVALMQPAAASCKLMAAATTAEDALIMLGALEVGTHGVLLRTDSPQEVRALVQAVQQRASQQLPMEVAKVTRVTQLGLGDRVCADLVAMLSPGEGLLVGSFARGFFLVHSECAESQYIASRPFRVNAGAVHSYVLGPGRTAYLSELRSGAEVLVVGPQGDTRTTRVGRCKLETRPMVLVEAQAVDGSTHSVILQNAETVKLVGLPREGHTSAGGDAGVLDAVSGCGNGSNSMDMRGWCPISVAALQPGDCVVLHRPAGGGARHTGIAIKEWVLEH